MTTYLLPSLLIPLSSILIFFSKPNKSGASGLVKSILSFRTLKRLVMLINAFVMLLLFPFRVKKRCSSSSSSSSSMSSMIEKPKDEKQEILISNRKAQIQRVSSPVSHRRSNVKVFEDHDVVRRRALAIKRASQEEEDDDSRSVREVSLFVTSRGDTLFTQLWKPVSVKIRALMVILHGLNEHSGRYSDFAKQLNSIGFKVYGMDWTGHGGSDGLHGYVHSLDDAVNDLKAFIEKVSTDNPRLPCFCFGHSTGGAIILKAVLDPKIEKLISGVVLTSPAVGVQPSHPIFGIIAPIFSYLLPKYQFTAANKNGLTVSRDPEALVAKYSDPLVYTGSIRVRTGYEILCISAYLQQNMNKLNVPFLVLHGSADGVTDPRGSKKLYEEASSSDKALKIYEGLLHDLLFEPEKEAIMKDIMGWLKSRVSE